MGKRKPSKDDSPKPVGRPSDYKPEYCQMLIEHMSAGYSYESFAGKIGKGRDTIYRWEKEFQDFQDAKKIGKDSSLKFWEDAGVEGMWTVTTTTSKNGDTYVTKALNSAIWIYNMKCRFRDQWNDSKEIKADDGKIKRVIIDLGDDE